MSKDLVFRISREFNVPVDLMWKAWTDREIAPQWFGPKGSKVTYQKFDITSGGLAQYKMEFGGAAMHGKWVYKEVVPFKKLVAIVSFTDEKGNIIAHPASPGWPKEMHSTITFTDKGGSTELLVEWKPHNASEAEYAVFEAGLAGMNQGWSGSFDALAELLDSIKR